MANPAPHKYEASHLGAMKIYVEFVPSSSSSVITINRGKEYIKSIALGTTGQYIITFKEAWNKFLDMNIQVEQATYDASHASWSVPSADAVNNQAAPTLTILTLSGSAGAATTVTDGDVVKGSIDLSYVKY